MNKKIYIDHYNNDKMRLIAEDIIKMPIKASWSLQKIMDEFYKIMRKHKIKLSTSSDGGKTFTQAAFEYTICKNMLKDNVRSRFDFAEWGIQGWKVIPDDVNR